MILLLQLSLLLRPLAVQQLRTALCLSSRVSHHPLGRRPFVRQKFNLPSC